MGFGDNGLVVQSAPVGGVYCVKFGGVMLQSPRIGSIHEMEEALSFSRGFDSSLGLGGSAEEWPTKLKGWFFRHGSKRVRDRIRTSGGEFHLSHLDQS